MASKYTLIFVTYIKIQIYIKLKYILKISSLYNEKNSSLFWYLPLKMKHSFSLFVIHYFLSKIWETWIPMISSNIFIILRLLYLGLHFRQKRISTLVDKLENVTHYLLVTGGGHIQVAPINYLTDVMEILVFKHHQFSLLVEDFPWAWEEKTFIVHSFVQHAWTLNVSVCLSLGR